MSILLSLQSVASQTAEQMPDLTGVTVPTEAQINIIDLAIKGGWIMIVLLVLSLIATYIFIQRLMVIRRAGKEDETFMNRIKDYIHEGKVDSALKLCRSMNTPSARMIEKGISRLGRPMNDVLVAIENVGNLVCPAAFDLGEAHKVVILSVTEGEDKPLKYPDMFHAADVMILNKIDLLPYLRFDIAQCEAYARRVNPDIEILHVSATNGEGMETWLAWLTQRRPAKV